MISVNSTVTLLTLRGSAGYWGCFNKEGRLRKAVDAHKIIHSSSVFRLPLFRLTVSPTYMLTFTVKGPR